MSPEGTDFLYPFIEGDERDTDRLLADLSGSANGKAAESRRLREATLAACRKQIDSLAADLADRLWAGGCLFTFGNGGSSTDAATVASLFARPPYGRPLSARSLVADQAVLTALGNDVGFELVFSRQLIAHGRAGDLCTASWSFDDNRRKPWVACSASPPCRSMASRKVTETPSCINRERRRTPHKGAVRTLFRVLSKFSAEHSRGI